MIPCSVLVRVWVGHLCRRLQVAEWVKLNRMQRGGGCVWFNSSLCWLQCCTWFSKTLQDSLLNVFISCLASRGLSPTPYFSTMLCHNHFRGPPLLSVSLSLSLCVTYNVPSTPMMLCLSCLRTFSLSLPPSIFFHIEKLFSVVCKNITRTKNYKLAFYISTTINLKWKWHIVRSGLILFYSHKTSQGASSFAYICPLWERCQCWLIASASSSVAHMILLPCQTDIIDIKEGSHMKQK